MGLLKKILGFSYRLYRGKMGIWIWDLLVEVSGVCILFSGIMGI